MQQLALEAVLEMRVAYRWQALDVENEAREQAKLTNTDYQLELLSNGDTVKQLLAHRRYVLYKKPTDWTPSQREQSALLFDWYTELKTAYELSQSLSHIFENTTDKLYYSARLAKWHERVRQAGFKVFNTVARSTLNHYETILNYFDNRTMPRPSRLIVRWIASNQIIFGLPPRGSQHRIFLYRIILILETPQHLTLIHYNLTY